MTYEVSVYCSNCGYRDYISIPKGKLVKDTKCLKCGCKTLN